MCMIILLNAFRAGGDAGHGSASLLPQGLKVLPKDEILRLARPERPLQMSSRHQNRKGCRILASTKLLLSLRSRGAAAPFQPRK